MNDDRNEESSESPRAGVNPGYAAHQIAKALTASKEHHDPEVRKRAEEKIAKWSTVLSNILTDSVDYGSRTPTRETPSWATLEVITGGFATGKLLAEDPIQDHERKLLENLPNFSDGKERHALNTHFLSEEGLNDLRERLGTGCYDISVPEEGALLVVAWLVEKGYPNEARELIDELSPFFSRLRFYPVPLKHQRRFGSRVHLKDAGDKRWTKSSF